MGVPLCEQKTIRDNRRRNVRMLIFITLIFVITGLSPRQLGEYGSAIAIFIGLGILGFTLHHYRLKRR